MTQPAPLQVGFALLAAGILDLVIAWFFFRRHQQAKQLMASGQQATGRITEVRRWAQKGGGTLIQAKYSFHSYTGEKIESSYHTIPPSEPSAIGDPAAVSYLTDDPKINNFTGGLQRIAMTNKLVATLLAFQPVLLVAVWFLIQSRFS